MTNTKLDASFPNKSEKLGHFRARLMAQLLVTFISITLAGQRLIYAFESSIVRPYSLRMLMLTLPFLFALSLLIFLKYKLYQRMPAQVLEYSDIFDTIFSLIFASEWLITLHAQLHHHENIGDKCYSLTTVITFGSLGWRPLLQILISQHWQIRIIGPTAVWIYLLQYGVIHDPSRILPFLFTGGFQMLYIILIFYFEHKVNFVLTIGNLQQEQWLQLNEFILNNVPENIAIMDSNGKTKFSSESFKRLINHHTHSNEDEQFFEKIKKIKKLPEEPDRDSESSCEVIPLFYSLLKYKEPNEFQPSKLIRQDSRCKIQDLDSLKDLISVFGSWINNGLVKEKSLYVFESKFKQDDSTEERSFQINISFINQSPHKYILLIIRDTTQRDLLLTLQGDMKYKDHLLASVSHELRTPLNGNINLLEAAIRSKDISTLVKEKLLQPAVKSSKFLLFLVNDILDLYQIKAQKLRLVFQQSSLKETITNTLQLLEFQAKKKGITLRTNICPTVPDTFCTDHARLSQIILNLMNNSIKFTQDGYVKLSAWSLRDSNNIMISIKDSGVGMAEEDINKLFKDFTHIESKDRMALNPTGVGLGLKIANDLTKLLGPAGNKGIIVESIVNKGSTFSFVIENKEAGCESQNNFEESRVEHREDSLSVIPNEFNHITESSLEAKILQAHLSKPSPKLLTELASLASPSICLCSCAQILVVDDDSFNIMAYEVILNSLGAKYECVYSGKNAIEKMLNKVRYPCSPQCHPYKLVFMDEEMPGMTGRETVVEINKLQKKDLLPPMQIIGCTAHYDQGKITEFLKSGIVEFVTKPISFDTIKKILEKYSM